MKYPNPEFTKKYRNTMSIDHGFLQNLTPKKHMVDGYQGSPDMVRTIRRDEELGKETAPHFHSHSS